MKSLDETCILRLDEKPNRTKLQLARMGMVYFGIELLFSLEIALTIPILSKLKVSEK